jgi:hypothetical protein
MNTFCAFCLPAPSPPCLALGDIVDSGSVFSPVGNGASFGHIGTGTDQFESGIEGYIGFKLDLTGSGDFVNGFMRVTLTDGNTEGTVHDWTYSDTPGEAVTVGPVPEPSSALLASILGMGLLLRRQRTCVR